ncbi:MAG: hypothetical protein ACLFPQ_04710, partial [Candidatus Woesearchaeota archaeon]
ALLSAELHRFNIATSELDMIAEQDCGGSRHCQINHQEMLSEDSYTYKIVAYDVCQNVHEDFINVDVFSGDYEQENDTFQIESFECLNCDNSQSSIREFEVIVSEIDDLLDAGLDTCDSLSILLDPDTGTFIDVSAPQFDFSSDPESDDSCIYRFFYQDSRPGLRDYKVKAVSSQDVESDLVEFLFEISHPDENSQNHGEQISAELEITPSTISLGRRAEMRLSAESTYLLESAGIINSGELSSGSFEYQESCNQDNYCVVETSFVPERLGTYSFKGIVKSLEGNLTDSVVKTLTVICPENNPCCESGTTIMYDHPVSSDENHDFSGCNKDNRYVSCNYSYMVDSSGNKIPGISVFESGTDSDNDGYDSECGDCDDSNPMINPSSTNPFCDCMPSVTDNPADTFQDLDGISHFDESLDYESGEYCSDGFDNDCDGKVDCFDEDCFVDGVMADSCNLSCTFPEVFCDGRCVDLDNDVNNCGECANACESYNSLDKCIEGECVNVRCRTGFADCDNILGCEVNIFTDENNCGDCGVSCRDDEKCQRGFCVQLSSDNSLSDKDNSAGDNQGNNENRPDNFNELSGEDKYVTILSPISKGYDRQKIHVKIDTNYDLSECVYRVGQNSIVFQKKEFFHRFHYGSNIFIVTCGNITKKVRLTVTEPVETSVNVDMDQTYRDPSEKKEHVETRKIEEIEVNNIIEEAIVVVKEKPKDSEGFAEEFEIKKVKQESTRNVTKTEQYYSVENEETLLSTKIVPDNELKDVEVYIEFPKCAAEYVDEIEFENENYKIVKDDPLVMWHFSEVNEDVELEYKVKKPLDADCVAQLKTLPIADEIGLEIERFRFANILPIILIPLISLVIIFFSKKNDLPPPPVAGVPTEEELEQLKRDIKDMKDKGMNHDQIMDELRRRNVDEHAIEVLLSHHDF